MLNHSIEKICPEINSFCRGVSAGADQVIMKYEKQCLDDNTDECTDLGDAASQGEKLKADFYIVNKQICTTSINTRLHTQTYPVQKSPSSFARSQIHLALRLMRRLITRSHAVIPLMVSARVLWAIRFEITDAALTRAIF
jgi:hypothetical protein